MNEDTGTEATGAPSDPPLARRPEETDAEQLLEILATGVAHAFNNVLASARASLQVARDRVGAEGLPAEVRGIETVLARGSTLTRSLLTLAHARQGRARSLHLLDLVEDTLELLEAGLTLQGITIARNYSRAPVVHASQAAVQRALLHAVLQAARCIDAAQRDLRLSFGRNGDDVTLDISWTRAEDLSGDEVRDRFEVVADTLHSTGARLVLEMGPQGDTVLSLQFVAATAERRHATEPRQVQQQPERALSVLVIDDEGVLRRMVASYLTLHGMHVQTAEDGPRGLSMAEGRRFDVVLLDLVMPGMAGEQVLEQLRTLCPQVPVIILSGLLDDTLAETVIQAGAWGVVAKPLQLDRLLATCLEAAAACAPP